MASINLSSQLIASILVFYLIAMHINGEDTNTTESDQSRTVSTELLSSQETGRTFGQIKKLQTALLPIMYKLGVISAVIMMTFFLALKGVFIGTLILILNLTFLAVKLGLFLKSDHHSHGWEPHGHGGWAPQKDVHLHIHNSHGKAEFIPYPNTFEHSTGPETHWSGYSPHPHAARQFPNEIIVKSIDDIKDVNRDNNSEQYSIHSNDSPHISELEIAAALIDKKSDKGVETNEVLSPYRYLRQSRDITT